MGTDASPLSNCGLMRSLPRMHGAGSPSQLVMESHRTKENDREMSVSLTADGSPASDTFWRHPDRG